MNLVIFGVITLYLYNLMKKYKIYYACQTADLPLKRKYNEGYEFWVSMHESVSARSAPEALRKETSLYGVEKARSGEPARFKVVCDDNQKEYRFK